MLGQCRCFVSVNVELKEEPAMNLLKVAAIDGKTIHRIFQRWLLSIAASHSIDDSSC